MSPATPEQSPDAAAATDEAIDDDAAGAGRVVLLTTTHRVAPGLLSWAAWELLHAADEVLCREPDHPQLPYLAEAGVRVTADPELPDAAEIVARCAGGRTVVILAGAEGEPRFTDGLARLAGSGRQQPMPALELLPGSYDLPGARLLDLVQVMDRIRRTCPWSARRTHADLAKHGIEETYELVEAIETGDRAELREELGDVLLQVIFHARIAEEDEEEPFSVDDVAATIVTKLINRHPHVFGDAVASTDAEVEAHWLRTKAAEKQRTSVTEGIPLSQPGLVLAAKLAGRARRAGLEVPMPTGPDIGYRLLALAAEAEAAGVDPETALRTAARTYRDAIRSAEVAAATPGVPSTEAPPET